MTLDWVGVLLVLHRTTQCRLILCYLGVSHADTILSIPSPNGLMWLVSLFFLLCVLLWFILHCWSDWSADLGYRMLEEREEARCRRMGGGVAVWRGQRCGSLLVDAEVFLKSVIRSCGGRHLRWGLFLRRPGVGGRWGGRSRWWVKIFSLVCLRLAYPCRLS